MQSAFATVVVHLALTSALAFGAYAGPSKGKNILFVMTDDQDAMLNGYDPVTGVGNMANLNSKVLAHGGFFVNYMLAYPLCSPSRSTLLTGRMPHNTGFTDNSKLNVSGFHPTQEKDTVNVWLENAGYHTMLAGKYINGYHTEKSSQPGYLSYVPPGWGDWYGLQSIEFFGSRVNVNGESVVYPPDAYQTDIIANLSLSWLRTTWQKEKPFFMWVTPHAPHAPYTPAPRHKGTLKGLQQPPDPAFNLADALQAKLPGNMANLSLVNATAMNVIYESRAEALLAVDEMIGELIDEIDAQGVLDNTWIFFTCDNGYHLGQHRLAPGKREFFEHDINVPFVVRGPGLTPGRVFANQVIGNYDLAATFAAIAGAAPTSSAPEMDGVSLLPLLTGNDSYPVWTRDWSLQEGWYTAAKPECNGGNASSPAYQAIRAEDCSFNGLFRSLFVRFCDDTYAFFDMTGDVGCLKWQTDNIVDQLDPTTFKMLSARLAEVATCKGAVCPGHGHQ